jgi:hypothetical protein
MYVGSNNTYQQIYVGHVVLIAYIFIPFQFRFVTKVA